MTISGLVKRDDLNGRRGTILGFTDGRYSVKVRGPGGESVRIKADNLTVTADVDQAPRHASADPTLRSKSRSVARKILNRPELRDHLHARQFLRAVDAADVEAELDGKGGAFLAAAADDDQAAEAVLRAVINSMVGPVRQYFPRTKGHDDYDDELLLRELKREVEEASLGRPSPLPLGALISDLDRVFGDQLGMLILRTACRMENLASVRLQARMPLGKLFCDNPWVFIDDDEEEMAVRRKDFAASIDVSRLRERLEQAVARADKLCERSRDKALSSLQGVLTDALAHGNSLPEEAVKPAMKAVAMRALLYLPLEALPGCLTADQVGSLLSAQHDAAYLAWLAGGWRASPDARFIRGFASMQRGNVAEAVLELSSAVSSDREWTLPTFQNSATTLLKQARLGQPSCFGLWRRCEVKDKNTRPSPRIAPACCQVDSCMYVFGGVCPDSFIPVKGTTYLSLINIALGVVTPEGPTSDLWRYTFGDRQWTLMSSKGATPPPRGFGLLTYYNGALYLYGGRVTWTFALEPYADVWRYTLADGSWERVAGDHPSMKHQGPHGVHDHGWNILDTDAKQPRLRRFDFASSQWSILAATSPVPRIHADLASSSGWLVDGSLWVFMVEAGRAEDTHVSETRLWEVKLSRASCVWQGHILASRCEHSPRFQGSIPVTCAESSACFDSESRKGYIFGGWTHDLKSFAARPDGACNLLEGRYFNVVIEVDVDSHVIRAVEPALAGSGGPTPRGYAGIGACGGKLTIFGGYTTFSKSQCRFVEVRTCMDYWECRLLADEETKLADPTHELNRNMATFTTVSYRDVFDSLRVAVLQNEGLRRLVSGLCEPRPGALVGIMNGRQVEPLSEEEFYAAGHLRWMPRDQILEYLPDLKNMGPDTYKGLHEIDPRSHATVLYVADYRQIPHVQVPVSYEVWTASCRWRPNTIYASQNALDKGEMKLSADETAPAVRDTVKVAARVQTCCFAECPNRHHHLSRSGQVISATLFACSRCRMVKYCSTECQSADWPQHKAACKRALKK